MVKDILNLDTYGFFLPNFGWSGDFPLSPFDSAEEVLLTAEGVGLGLRFLNYEVEKKMYALLFFWIVLPIF